MGLNIFSGAEMSTKPIFCYLELLKVTVTYGPVGVLPPPSSNGQKLPIRNSWELLIGKLPMPVPMFYYFELIREALANTLKTSRKKKIFAEDISEDFSEDRRYHF